MADSARITRFGSLLRLASGPVATYKDLPPRWSTTSRDRRAAISRSRSLVPGKVGADEASLVATRGQLPDVAESLSVQPSEASRSCRFERAVCDLRAINLAYKSCTATGA